MGTMTNEITPPVSSVTQPCFASDKKETSLAFVASKGKIINKKISCCHLLQHPGPLFWVRKHHLLIPTIIVPRFCARTHSVQLNQNHLVSTLNQSAKIPASALTMDQIVFHLCLPWQQHPSGLYLLLWYLLKRKTSKKMLKGSSTPSKHVYYFLHLLFIQIQMIGLRNLWKPCWRTENSLKKPNNKCMKKRSKNASLIFHLSDKKLIDVQEDNYPTLDDSIKSIFRYYKEQNSTDWKSMMRETLPIFISPAILNKSWMIRVKR